MTPKAATVAAAFAALALLAWAVWSASKNQHILEAGLPPKTVCADDASAREAAISYARATGTRWAPVLGTGSMAPFLPPAASNPASTVVAYAVYGGRFEDVTPGALCVYSPSWAGGRVIHCAALRTSAGWVMSGLHNSRSEAWEPMTAATFCGVVACVYVW